MSSYPSLYFYLNRFNYIPCNYFCSYVAEMMNNRLLRYFERPEGVYHGSVFYQFSGGIGPSGVTVDKDGNIYVAQYDILGKRLLVNSVVIRSYNIYFLHRRS